MPVQPDGAITTVPTGAITDQVFSPDGHTLYTARNGTITAYDVSTDAVIGSWTIGTQLGGIDISADGKSIVAVELTPGSTSGTSPNITVHYSVYQLDLTSGATRTFDFPVTGGYPEGYGDVSFLSDGTVLIAGGGQWQPLTTLNLSTGVTTTTSQTFEAPTLTASADHTHVLVSPLNISDAPLFLYSTGSGITASHELYADNIEGFNAGVQAISPNGNMSAEGVSLAVYDSNLHLITKLADRYPFGAAGMAFSPDGSKLYVLDPAANEVFVLSTSNWDVLGGYSVGASVTGSSSTSNGTVPATHYGNALLVSSDGTHLAVDTAVSVQIIDLTKAISDSGTSAGNDTLIGDSAPNVLYGFEGNDILDGRGGADIMYGGPGDDTYYVDNVSDQVIEKPNEGNDTIYSSAVYYTLPSNVETLVLATGGVTAYGNSDANHLVGNDSDNQLFGYAGDDLLVGNGGNDILDGGPGNDTMQGGSGDDIYYVDSPGDIVQEDPGNGTDKVIASVSYTLPANVENLELTAGNYPLVGHGNELDNVLIADGAEDVLYGLAGNDTLIGGPGTQYLYGGSGSDTLTGGPGDDVFGGTAADLNGDTITDFSAGDKVLISDATIPSFSFTVSGNVLSYTGGSLTLGYLPFGQHLAATAAAGGGVQLTLVANAVHDDFNGGALGDILWRSDSGQFSDWLSHSNRDGGFAGNDANAFASAPTSWHVAGTGDFNGDGREDVLWRSDSGQLSNWIADSNGDGGFSNNDANASVGVSTAWQVAGIGDFNGDGLSDILWRNATTGQLSDWLAHSNGDGGFSNNDANAFVAVSTSWSVVGTGDFNGDGLSDILWRNTTTGQLSDWLGTSAGGWTMNDANALTTASSNWHVVAVGDFNGDGRADILWRSDNGQLSDWLGQSNGGFLLNDANTLISVPTNWHVTAVGDYNGDGITDLLWRSSGGQLSDWLGQPNGGFVVNDAKALVNVPTSWHVQDSFVHDPFGGI